MDLFSLLADLLPLLVTVIGLYLAGMASFRVYPHSERKWAARIGAALVIIGICGIIWPVFVLVYLLLMVIGLVTFAGVGIYRSFK
jgi:hypothetical protein